MANNAYINIDSKPINRENKLSFILDGTEPKSFLDEVHDRLKYINENFFFNKLVITLFGYDSFRITDSISDGDGFPIYIEEDIDVNDSNKIEYKYIIEFSHKQNGKFMWYVNWVLLKELAIYFNQDKIYDEGVGDISIKDMKTHEPSKDLKILKDNIYNVKSWDKELMWYNNNDEMVKFFNLDRTSKFKKMLNIAKISIELIKENKKYKGII